MSNYTHGADVLDSATDVLYSSFKDTPYNTGTAVQDVREYLERMLYSNLHDVLIVLHGGAVVGVGIGVTTVPWYNLCTRDFSELAVGVSDTLPAIMKMRVLKTVHNALEAAAKARGCNSILVGTSSGVRTQAYTRVLAKRGYKMFGITMKKEL